MENVSKQDQKLQKFSSTFYSEWVRPVDHYRLWSVTQPFSHSLFSHPICTHLANWELSFQHFGSIQLDKIVHNWLVCAKHLTQHSQAFSRSLIFLHSVKDREQELYYLHSTRVHSPPPLVSTTFSTPALLTWQGYAFALYHRDTTGGRGTTYLQCLLMQMAAPSHSSH